jgi:hypothetical protein
MANSYRRYAFQSRIQGVKKYDSVDIIYIVVTVISVDVIAYE